MAFYQRQQDEQQKQQLLLPIVTITDCNIAFEKSYCSREGARNSKLPRRRTVFTDEQLSQLEDAFQKCQYPKIDVRMKLASETQLPETCIQISVNYVYRLTESLEQLELAVVDDDIYQTITVWFKNRRAKYRKKLRNIANPEIVPNTLVPKFNAVITWRPNDAFIFVTSAREVVACNNYSTNMITNCL